MSETVQENNPVAANNLSALIGSYIDGQYRCPTGPVGRWIGGKMAEQHRPENLWTVSLLDVRAIDHILEVGFGPGVAIQEVSRCATAGLVSGIDFSATMVSVAVRRNVQAMRAGRVDLRHGDAARLPFADNAFDKAFSIHSIYFWPRPLDALKEVHRVLKPGGVIILTVLPKEKWTPNGPGSDSSASVGTADCRPYSGEELQAMLTDAGFRETRVESDSNPHYPSNYSVIGLK